MRQLQQPAETLGTVRVHVFFSTAGAPGVAIADSVVQACLPPWSLCVLCLDGVHFLTMYLLHRFCWRSPSLVAQRLLLFVASSAAKGGPATAVVLAQANDWRSTVLPSFLIGNSGYAMAIFWGLGFTSIFGRFWWIECERLQGIADGRWIKSVCPARLEHLLLVYRFSCTLLGCLNNTNVSRLFARTHKPFVCSSCTVSTSTVTCQ